MMQSITCACLNVRIFSKTDVKNAKAAIFDPPPDHPFFLTGSVFEVTLHIQGIRIEHNYLIERTNCQGWMIHKCVNCNILTHAKHLDDDRTLVSSGLPTEKADIENLKANPNYSSLYKIVIEKPVSNNSSLTISNNIRNVLQSIQSNFESYVQKEEVELNNRIKQYEALEREKFDGQKSKLMQEKNRLLTIIINNDLNKCQGQEVPETDESFTSAIVESNSESTLSDYQDFIEPSSPQSFEDFIGKGIPKIVALSQTDVDNFDSRPIPKKLFRAFNREYSPIVSPLTFGVSNAIPEEDEHDEGDQSDDENEIKLFSSPGKSCKDEDVAMKRIELKLPLKPTKSDAISINQKSMGPLGKLLKQDAVEKSSFGSLETEDVFMLNIDSDDQKGDVNANFTSDEDEVLQSRIGTTDESSGSRTRGGLFSTSVPIEVPVPLRQNSRDVDVVEDIPPDPESMAASIIALAKSCHGENDIFGELPRSRAKTPRLQHTSLGQSLDEPHLVV